ncbi:protein phosphatase 1, regulatory subunit 3Db [Nerophis lumbriciformis]|uniref:protein phosphatase 1, regulatory subunit 3Db n=1 Tax=Nerophis lumbriciformis TaxID=546530 RepID=UPI002AE05B2F|nr:protein phosphatase 1 regulatory subunit 3D-like [Nerophis lumbriciformis]
MAWRHSNTAAMSGSQLQPISGPGTTTMSKTTAIRLRYVYDPKPQLPKAPVPIRPPSPRPVSAIADSKLSSHSHPPTKTIMRRRAQSLSVPAERRSLPRSPQVRFVDSLGLDLEEVKVFKVKERPLIPQHVMFRLLMSSEMAFGTSLELSLPHFKPCFPENQGTQPDFLERVHAQFVCLDRVTCTDLGITGTVQVLNLDYEKKVDVRYSFTNWRTSADTTASWVSSGSQGDHGGPGTDVFRFRLHVPPFILQPGGLLEFAVRYRVKGSDHWDNNRGRNYKLSCHCYKVTVPRECEDSMLHFT